MPVSQAINSEGAQFFRGDGGSPEVFTAMADFRGISGLRGGNAAIIDVTHLGSTAIEKAMGLPDEGQAQVQAAFVPDDAVQLGMEADRLAQAVRNFRVTLADAGATQFDFAALVTSTPIITTINDVVTITFTLEITGAIATS